jgi:hypothetical protein
VIFSVGNSQSGNNHAQHVRCVILVVSKKHMQTVYLLWVQAWKVTIALASGLVIAKKDSSDSRAFAATRVFHSLTSGGYPGDSMAASVLLTMHAFHTGT